MKVILENAELTVVYWNWIFRSYNKNLNFAADVNYLGKKIGLSLEIFRISKNLTPYMRCCIRR